MTILDLSSAVNILIPVDRTPVEPPTFVSRQVTEARRFYLNLKPPAGHSLTVVCGGWESCAPDFRVERTDFPFLCLEFVAGGSGSLLLFVVMSEGSNLDAEVHAQIAGHVRALLSPRHVPDQILQISVVPRTLSGKKVEVPVKRVLRGAVPSDVVSLDSLTDRFSLDQFVGLIE